MASLVYGERYHIQERRSGRTTGTMAAGVMAQRQICADGGSHPWGGATYSPENSPGV